MSPLVNLRIGGVSPPDENGSPGGLPVSGAGEGAWPSSRLRQLFGEQSQHPDADRIAADWLAANGSPPWNDRLRL
jgi:hypothetical protein